MTLRNVTKSFNLEDQRQEINVIAADLATFYDNDTDSVSITGDLSVTAGVSTFGGGANNVQIGSAGDLWAENALYVGDSSSPTISLYANGTASFGSGNHTINTDGSYTLSDYINCGTQVYVGAKYANGTGVLLNGDNSGGGEVNVRNDTGSSRVWFASTGGNSVAEMTSEILASGNATFVSTVTAGTVTNTARAVQAYNNSTSNSTIIAQNEEAGPVWQGWGSGGNTSSITSAGAATFADEVRSGGNPHAGTADGSHLNGGSGVSASYSADGAFLWRGYKTGNSTPTSSISVAGAATFASTIQSKGNPMNGAAEGSQLAGDSGVIACSNTGSQKIWRGFQGSNATATSSITAAGAATFASTINTGGNPWVATANGGILYYNGTTAFSSDQNTYGLWRGYTTGTNVVTSEIFASGAATFAGDITGNGGFTGKRTNNDYHAFRGQNTGGAQTSIITGGGTVELGAHGSTGWIKLYGPHEGGAAGRITNAGCTLYENGDATFSGPVKIGGTAAANTMEEYEEGTFTPTFSTQAGGTTTVSYTVQTGRYTKIGDTVHYYLQLQMAVTAWGSGEWLVSGLPFPCWSSYNNPPAQASRIYWYDGSNYTYQRQYVDYRWDHWWNQDKLFALVPSNGSSENDYRGTTATNLNWIVIMIHGTYFTN